MHHVAALALFMGPGLVMVAVNEAWRVRSKIPPPIGVPLTEAYADPIWTPVQRTMRAVFDSGCPTTVRMPGGVLTIAPLIEDGRTVGVGTHYRPLRETPRSSPGLPGPVRLRASGAAR